MGLEFMNELFTEITRMLRIEHANSTPYHPQTIGSLERNHRNLNEFLRMFVNEHLDDWSDYVKFYEFSYNTSPCVAHGYTPYELVFGKRMRMPYDVFQKGVEPVYDLDNYANELKHRLQLAHKRANELLHKTKHKRKQELDLNVKVKELRIGDRVYLNAQNNNKLQSLRSGPYEVINVDTPNVTIKMGEIE